MSCLLSVTANCPLSWHPTKPCDNHSSSDGTLNNNATLTVSFFVSDDDICRVNDALQQPVDTIWRENIENVMRNDSKKALSKAHGDLD